jgi:tetratricopeptide (TPR) repeat protein
MARFACVILLLAAAVAAGQSTEMTLSGTGEWVAAARAPKSADAMVMDQARQLLAEDKPGRARSLLTRWIDEHEFIESPYMSEAYLLRADAKTAGGNEYRALFDYEIVAKEYEGTQEFVRAVERELEIGVRYLGGLRRRLLGMRIVRAESIGEELVLRTAERMPGSRLAERAVIELADYYYRTRDLESAETAYKKFVQLFPRSQHVTRARQQRIFASIGQFKGPNYDAAGLQDAKILIEEYSKDDPIGAQRANLSDALVARLDESIAAQMLEKARFYIRRGDPVSARATLRRLIKDHPRSVAASQGRALMAEKKWIVPQKAASLAPPEGSQPQAPGTGTP